MRGFRKGIKLGTKSTFRNLYTEGLHKRVLDIERRQITIIECRIEKMLKGTYYLGSVFKVEESACKPRA